MIKDLFWHTVVLTVIGFFALTAISCLPQWRTNADFYAPPQVAATTTAAPAAHQALAMRMTKLNGVELASAK